MGDLSHGIILLEKHSLEKIVQMYDALGNKGTPGKQMMQDGTVKAASVLTYCLN